MSDPRARTRRPVARHGQLRGAHPVTSVVRFLAVAAVVVVVAAASVAAIALGSVATNFKANEIKIDDPVGSIPTIGAHSGAVNLLLVGSDTRNGQKGHYGSNPGSTLNDVNILIHVSNDHTKATIISFPRDMYVNVPACKNPNATGQYLEPESDVKLNTTLYYGGAECVRDTVASLTGIKIPYVALITFDGVVEMSNAVGGVQVCVATAINDDYTDLHLSKGEHTLKGAKALEFLRTRHGVGDGSDLTRISSQQVFLSSLVRKLKSSDTLTDVTKLYGIASAASTSMNLSTSLDNVDTLVSIGRAIAPIDLNDVVFVQYPTYISGDGVLPSIDSANVLMKAVAADKTLKLSKSTNGGSEITTTPSPSPSPTTSASPRSSSSASPSPSPTSSDTVTLPSGVSGQTAAEKSCSVGNDLGTR